MFSGNLLYSNRFLLKKRYYIFSKSKVSLLRNYVYQARIKYRGSYSFLMTSQILCWASQLALAVKNLSANAENIREVGSIAGSGKSARGGYGNPLHFSCLENPMARGTWWGTIHVVAKSRTRLKQLSVHAWWLTENSFRQNFLPY